MSGKSGSDSSSSRQTLLTGSAELTTAVHSGGAADHTLYITGWEYHRQVSCYYNTQRETTIIKNKNNILFYVVIFGGEIGILCQ